MKRPRASIGVGYEARDMAPRHIGYAAALLFAGIALSAGLVAGMLGLFDHPKSPATALETTVMAPPLPRLEIDGRADRAAVEADARRKLESYAWVDCGAGIARIPVARAMQLLVARGWPDAPRGARAP